MISRHSCVSTSRSGHLYPMNGLLAPKESAEKSSRRGAALMSAM